MNDLILILNAGSSSLKFALRDDSAELPLEMKGGVFRLRDAPALTIVAADREALSQPLGGAPMSGAAALETVFAELRARGLMDRIVAVGHRIVHGGNRFVAPVRLDNETIAALRELIPLAPLHQPFNLDVVEAARRVIPHAVQIGCFDTSFHADQPRLARIYALPRSLTDEGVTAYGFHGLSYAHIAEQLRVQDGARAGGRAVVAHLGSGASLCAMREGRSVATTMGFSALDGPPMATRCGALDPGVVLHLIQERGLSVEAVGELLYERSGLLGVSGLSGDMQILLASDDPRAREAVDLFVYRIGREIGSLAAALGGLDTLVFTAGVGENAPEIRARIGETARWLRVEIDPERNTAGAREISPDDARVRVLVIPTDEERVAAEAVRAWRKDHP